MSDHATPARLEVRGLGFRYAHSAVDVLTDVSFRVESGQSIGILGPNGAGKSTLLGAVLGTLDGTRQGSVEIDGVAEYDPAGFGYASQEVALYATLTVRENIEHLARLTVPKPRRHHAVETAIGTFGLEELAARPVHKLSGGQVRLTHLATSFVHDPPVLMLDEPTAGLDFVVRQRLVALVHRWRDESRSVIVTAHVPEDIEEMCSDLVLIKDGRSTALGSVETFLRSHGEALQIVLREDGVDREVEIDLPDSSLAPIAKNLADLADEAPAASTASLSLSSSLRAILRTDPGLRSYVTEEPAEERT